MIFYSLCILYVLSMALVPLDTAKFILAVSNKNSIRNNNSDGIVAQELGIKGRIIYTTYMIPTIICGCCDFISQSILVRMNHVYHLFIHANLQRSTAAGLCGDIISMSCLFPQSYHSRS